MAFVFIAIHHPKPEHRDDVFQSMTRVGDLLRGSPGLVQVGPWKEEEGNRLIGLSIWRQDHRLLVQRYRGVRQPHTGHGHPAGQVRRVDCLGGDRTAALQPGQPDVHGNGDGWGLRAAPEHPLGCLLAVGVQQ